MIDLVVFDIDGVLTDGSLTVNAQGQEQKKLNIKDVDAICELKRRGYHLAAVTGADTKIVAYFERLFPWDKFYKGCKKKSETIRALCAELGVPLEGTAYIGDGKYDLEVLPHAGLSVCPADAIREVRLHADVVLQKPGGGGCVWELLDILETDRQLDSPLHYFNARIEKH